MSLIQTIKEFLESRERLLQLALTVFFILLQFAYELKPHYQLRFLIGIISVCSILSMIVIFSRQLQSIPQAQKPISSYTSFYQAEEMKLGSLYQQQEPVSHLIEQPQIEQEDSICQYSEQEVVSRRRVPAFQGLKNHFQNKSVNVEQKQLAPQREPSQAFDNKSNPSVSYSRMTMMTNHGQLFKGGDKKCVKILKNILLEKDEDKKISEKFMETEKYVKQQFKINLSDLSKRTRSWLIESFLPLFINEYKQTIYGLEKLMNEYFDKRLKEIQILYAENILDQNLHQWNESMLSKKETTVEYMLDFYTQFRLNNTSIWTINDPAKFKRDDLQRFFKLCQEMELYHKILFISNDRRQFPSFKLNQICKSKVINFNSDVVPEKNPSDLEVNRWFQYYFEILSSVFFNAMNCSIEYESTAPFRACLNEYISTSKMAELRRERKKSQETLKFLRVGIVSNEMWAEKKISSSKDDEEILKFQSFFVQQINNANPLKEPHFHFSSMLLQYPKQDQNPEQAYKPRIFISPAVMDEKGMFVALSLYCLHLVLVPSQSFNSMMSYPYNQKFLGCLIDFVKDISFQVNI